MTILVDVTLRMSVIVLASLLAASFLRRHSAALRHWVLAIGIACGAAVPVAQAALPAWPVGPVGRSHEARLTAEIAQPQGAARMPAARPPAIARAPLARPADASGRPFPAAGAVLVVWAIGALASLSMLMVSLLRLSRIASGTRPCSDRRLSALALEIGTAFGLRRPVALLESSDPSVLITWGAVRPRVVLPPDARQWSDDRARVVLRHELAHVARGDWLTQMLAETLSAVYWFNPLVWIASRRLRAESERACDDAVLSAGVDATDYASHLVALARNATGRSTPVLAMARPSSLEGRVAAMLNAHVNRRPLRLVTRIATVVAFVALSVPLAVAQARFSTLSGTVADQTNRFVPGVTLVLTNSATQAKYEVRSDAAGRFQFVGLPAGDYQFEARQMGFKTYKSTVAVAGQDLTRAVQLQIGSVQETIHVSSAPPSAPDPERQASAEKSRQQRAEEARRRAGEACSGSAAADTTGGRIMAPRKLVDVKPAFPDSLEAAGIAGEVTLEAIIGTDGAVREVTALSSPHPELERLAADAVRQWQFTPTYLDCTPVEVPIRVTVTFEAK